MSTTISIPRNAALKSALKSSNHSHNNTMSEELSETYSSVLGKRKLNDTSVEELRALNDESSNSIDSNLDGDNPEKRQKRLLQNRKSAKKCRLKKKAEFDTMKNEVTHL